MAFAANGDGSEKGAVPPQLQGIGITDRLGAQVSIQDLKFQDETGADVTLSKYFSTKKPVLLAVVYYACPSLCTLVLNGVIDSLKQMSWTPGKEFELVAVSMNHKETPELAAKKKESYLKEYGKAGTESGWHFLVGKEDQVKKLTDQIL
jgi:protein SCO1/2